MTDEKNRQPSIEVVDIDSLVADDQNFNRGTDEGKQLIARSFKEHGAGRSVLLDKNNRLVAGNKATEGARQAGIRRVIVVDTEGDEMVAVRRKDVDLDSAEGRKMALLDNLTQQVSLAWDADAIQTVSSEIEGFDPSDYGFDPSQLEVVMPTGDETEEEAIERKRREFEEKMKNGELDEDDPEYQEFVKKFEAKRTTDDCYTPDVVYDAVAEWVASEYNVSRANFVRPFYPGGDYQKEKYKPTDIVVDNPPFSILASIIDWYNERGIRYFLFGPQLTLLGTTAKRCACLAVGVTITYANGAQINTSFATNMEPEDVCFRACGSLYKAVNDANEQLIQTKKLPRYAYPKHIVMSQVLHKISRFGFDFVGRRSQCEPIEELDAQREVGKVLYGKGFIISDHLVNEREIIEKQIAEKEEEMKANVTAWELSEREREIIERLNQNK